MSIFILIFFVAGYLVIGRLVTAVLFGLMDDRDLRQEPFELIVMFFWPLSIIVAAVTGIWMVLRKYEFFHFRWFDRFFWQVGYRIRNFFKKG